MTSHNIPGKDPGIEREPSVEENISSKDQDMRDRPLETDGVILGYGGVEIVTTNPPKKQKIDKSGKRKKGAEKKPKGGKGHFSQHIKSQLNSSGKLNSGKPMTPEQRRKRRSKRK